jgi:uncharacterized protein YdgA (DUF945 family)
MKKIIVAAVLIIAIGCTLPFFSGLLMERTVRRAFEDINALYAVTATGYSLEIIDYKRGYSTSEIEWKIDLGPFKALYPIDEIVFTDHAKHGVSGVVSTTSLEKNPWFASLVNDRLQGKNPLHISTNYSILGKIRSTTTLDAFSVPVEDDIVDVRPANLFIETDYKLDNFMTSANWQGLSAGAKFAIGSIAVTSDMEKISDFIWDGSATVGIEYFKGQEDEKQFELKGIKSKYLLTANQDQTRLTGEARLSIDGLKAEDLTVDNASVRLAASGLDVKGYEEFMRMYTQSMAKLMSNMAALQKDPGKAGKVMHRQTAALGMQLVAAYEKLMKKGLEFQISNLLIKMADKEIKGRLTLRLLKDITFAQLAPIVAQPDLLLDIFYLKSDLSLPVDLVGENPKLLMPAYPGMQTGLFVQNGDYLTHESETINGKLMLNSQEVILTQ